jgi:hypothetical protein
MATTKHTQKHNAIRVFPWSRLRWGAMAVALVLLALLAWKWGRLREDAVTGASFGARIACSCRYVEGRDLAQCRKDFEPGMGLVMLSEDSAAKSVTARFPLLASQTATFRNGEGCVLEKWAD